MFDQRGRPEVRRDFDGGTIAASRRKGEPELTLGDRLVTALIGFVCAFLTMCLVWLIALRYSRSAMEPPLPFY